MISVLCPSRERIEQLQDSIHSIATFATRRHGVEFLIGADEDDPQVGALRDLTGFNWGVRTHVRVFERFGYRELHRYYNGLAEWADGDWLLLWNDDARMRSDGWDVAIHEHDHRAPVALNLTSEQAGAMNIFPCVSSTWYEAVGHMSLQAHTDTWIQDTSRAAGVERNETRVLIDHLREGDGDPAAYAITSPEFYTPAFADLRAIDAEKLREAFHAHR